MDPLSQEFLEANAETAWGPIPKLIYFQFYALFILDSIDQQFK